MTPTKRTEKILETLAPEPGYPWTNWVKDFVTAEIREAVEEATQEALKVRDKDVGIVVDNVNKATAEAYERGYADGQCQAGTNDFQTIAQDKKQAYEEGRKAGERLGLENAAKIAENAECTCGVWTNVIVKTIRAVKISEE